MDHPAVNRVRMTVFAGAVPPHIARHLSPEAGSPRRLRQVPVDHTPDTIAATSTYRQARGTSGSNASENAADGGEHRLASQSRLSSCLHPDIALTHCRSLFVAVAVVTDIWCDAGSDTAALGPVPTLFMGDVFVHINTMRSFETSVSPLMHAPCAPTLCNSM
jgi:hypothetical protein